MNIKQEKYKKFNLVKEMLETPSIIKNFESTDLSEALKSINKTKKLFLTGEGSSRIFPAKNMIYTALKKNFPLTIYAQGAREASEFNLKNFTLFAASNSGKTKEVISLFKKMNSSKFVLTENKNSLLKNFSKETFILNCGKEKAVSATKSVIEESLFYHNLLLKIYRKKISKNALNEFSKKAIKVLEIKIDNKIILKLTKAKLLYFAGRDNGVAEEAALKANEIIGKKSCYLEGTYAIHGVEEAMDKNDAVIIIDPFEEEEKKFKEVLIDGVGMEVIAISPKKTIFPTIRIPKIKDFDSYLQLLACWNLLVEIGIKLGINLDNPVRARKIGNEYL